MSRDARWKALLELLVERGRLDVEEAAAELEVSAATIRRDFDQLAEQQMLVRTRGGAVVHGVSYELPLRYKTARRASEKQRIAKAVAALVAPGRGGRADRRHDHHRGGARPGRARRPGRPGRPR